MEGNRRAECPVKIPTDHKSTPLPYAVRFKISARRTLVCRKAEEAVGLIVGDTRGKAEVTKLDGESSSLLTQSRFCAEGIELSKYQKRERGGGGVKQAAPTQA